MKSQARGGTRWKRFAVVMVPSVAASGVVVMAIAQGALAASFSVSGQQFEVAADHIKGTGFTQYGAADPKGKNANPVAVVGLHEAKIRNLCQAVTIPTPFGKVGLKLTAGNGGTDVEATTLFIDATDMNVKTAVFNNIDIGVSSDHITKGPGKHPGDNVVPDSFTQQADSVEFSKVKQTAWATSAGTFTLPDLKMGVSLGAQKCEVK